MSYHAENIANCRLWLIKHVVKAERSVLTSFQLQELSEHQFTSRVMSTSMSQLHGVSGKRQRNKAVNFPGVAYRHDVIYPEHKDLSTILQFLRGLPYQHHICTAVGEVIILTSASFGSKQLYVRENRITVKADDFILRITEYHGLNELYDHLLKISNSFVCRLKTSPTCARLLLANSETPPRNCDKCNAVLRAKRAGKRKTERIETPSQQSYSQEFTGFLEDQKEILETRKYPKEVIDDSLVIYSKSPATYRFMRERGRFGKLPCESTLRRRKSGIKPGTGGDVVYLEWLKEEAEILGTPLHGSQEGLCLDGMSIQEFGGPTKAVERADAKLGDCSQNSQIDSFKTGPETVAAASCQIGISEYDHQVEDLTTATLQHTSTDTLQTAIIYTNPEPINDLTVENESDESETMTEMNVIDANITAKSNTKTEIEVTTRPLVQAHRCVQNDTL